MEMPNTVPQALTQDLLQDKYDRAAEVSPVNYSFFMGASNHNLDEVLKTDPTRVCGIKVFMGSSTGDMLVDESAVLEGIFKEAPTLVATHCEDEATVRANSEAARARFGETVPIAQHPLIRSAEACYKSSSKAVELATKLNTQLHILHISTARELDLFDNTKALEDKRITAEACIHHLWFSDADYESKGTHIKWNPAVKTAEDREQIRAAILDGRIDVVATDHAPTPRKKNGSYFKAPSGGPLVQHALVAMLDMVHDGVLSVEKVADLMAHRVARLFRMSDRGFIRPGMKADLVLVHPNDPWTVREDNVMSKCGWSPQGTRSRVGCTRHGSTARACGTVAASQPHTATMLANAFRSTAKRTRRHATQGHLGAVLMLLGLLGLPGCSPEPVGGEAAPLRHKACLGRRNSSA